MHCAWQQQAAHHMKAYANMRFVIKQRVLEDRGAHRKIAALRQCNDEELTHFLGLGDMGWQVGVHCNIKVWSPIRPHTLSNIPVHHQRRCCGSQIVVELPLQALLFCMDKAGLQTS